MASEVIHIVFGDFPGPEASKFMEIEDSEGNSIRAGQWFSRPDGNVELRLRIANRSGS